MQRKAVLESAEVNRMVTAARAEAQKNKWPVTVAVVDDGGHLLALERLDDCAPISAYIATEKARTAALGRRDTKNYEEMINSGRTALITAPLLTSLEGGLPLVVEGKVIAAIGVSGVKPEQDAQIAAAGVAAL
ncbi:MULTISPECIES: heme-binding protein [unclassified Pseudomonas]|jgi:glc operon protein GlcG|uniref:heme-binding protein n=1 Tax=unclassified Pseudomonas TaxID=196821 RepID=UPI001CBDD2A1|nr:MULTISPECIES: heme-binding protein [unclassified Pseudomonas]